MHFYPNEEYDPPSTRGGDEKNGRRANASPSGETLERRGDKVWRIEDDGSSRGYVEKWS